MTEFELKFEVTPVNLQGVVMAMQHRKPVSQRLQASYFDTADGTLAKHGIVVRLRKEGRRWVQTAKGPTADVVERLEHNAALPPQPAGLVPVLDLSLHRGTPVGNAIDKALGLGTGVGVAETYPRLVLLYSTDVKRVTTRVLCHGSDIEVALDQGRVFSADHSQPLCELEFELKEGSPEDAITLARQWCAAHGLWMSTVAKSMKGQRLGCQSRFGAATSATAPQFSPGASAHDMLRAVLKACLAQVLPNMSELAGGSNHPDHIHQLRVGLRRLRTALSELGGNIDAGNADCAIDSGWQAVLTRAFRALGTHRDQSNLALVMQPQLLAAGGPDIRLDTAGRQLAEPGRIVREPEFQDAMLGLLGLVHGRATEPSGKADSLKKAMSLKLAKRHKRALRGTKKFLTLSEEQQHTVRKRLKQLRYLMEFVAPLFTAQKVKRMTAALKPAQDALGVYNDELMALQAWHLLAADDAKAWFGVGWLTARKQPNANRCLKEIRVFAAIKPFWTH